MNSTSLAGDVCLTMGFTETKSGECNEVLNWTILLVSLLVLLLLLLCSCCCCCYRCGRVRCQFCAKWQKVGGAVEAHRKECFKRHRNIIETFRKHPRATCTKERHRVFLWPKVRGDSSFLCCNRNCKTMEILAAMKGKLGVEGRQEVKNTGKERFYCLICDFNICYVCADKYTGNEQEAERRWGPVIK